MWHTQHSRKAYVFLQQLLSDFGAKKLYSPQNKVLCLGILVNVINSVIATPEEKLEQVKQICSTWASTTKVNKSELQSLTGLLVYINVSNWPDCLLIIYSIPYTEPLTKIMSNLIKDIAWCNQFQTQFNGSVLFYKALQSPITTDYMDACMGGCWNNQGYVLPNTHLVGIHNKSIVHLEMYMC